MIIVLRERFIYQTYVNIARDWIILPDWYKYTAMGRWDDRVNENKNDLLCSHEIHHSNRVC